MPLLRPFALIACFLLVAAAQAQNQPPKISKPPQPAAGRDAKPPANSVELAEEPFRLKSVGLTMRLPAGAASQITGSGDQTSAQIMPADKSWLLTIQTPVSRNAKATPESVAADVRDQLLSMAGIPERTLTREGVLQDKGRKDGQPAEKLASTTAQIVEDVKAVMLPGVRAEESRPAARVYVKLPGADKEQSVVRGYTIFRISPGHFVGFDLVAPESEFARARVATETAIATVRFTDPAAMAATRGAAVEAGVALLSSLTAKDYDAAIAGLTDQYHRRYKPTAGGADRDAKELAYRRIRAWKGQRGQIDPSRAPAKWATSDRQDGYLVEVDARIIDDSSGGQPKIIDSIGVYFMTPDRKEEAWNLRMIIRDPAAKHPAEWRELGARSGSSMSVVTDGSGESKAAQPSLPPEGYITQVESILLPQLLIGARKPDANGKAGEYGFYTYQSEVGRVRLRTDKLGEAQDRAGAWKLESQLNEDRDPQTAIYNERGDMVQITLPDDSVWKPIELPRLAEVWRTKGLPMDTPAPPPARR